jgi:hypothetical protein
MKIDRKLNTPEQSECHAMPELKVGGRLTVKGRGGCCLMTHSECAYVRSFQATPWIVCKLVNNSSNLRCTSIFQREKNVKMCILYSKYFKVHKRDLQKVKLAVLYNPLIIKMAR